MTEVAPGWLHLEGGANARDLGGLPTEDGRTTRPGVLIRSANLQHLTDEDLKRLVLQRRVRRVIDLRSDVEVSTEGPGPMTTQPDVVIHHLSLLPNSTDVADRVDPVATARSADANDAMATAESSPPAENLLFPGSTDPAPAVTASPVANSYLRFLSQRPESLVAALRAISEPDGATLIHCAAGKDRTGMVVAIALSLVGVNREAIVADYAASEESIDDIRHLLARNATYAKQLSDPGGVKAPRAEVIELVLEELQSWPGGIQAWLGQHGWSVQDTERLQARLLS
ncbi:tyrosine-protein phosphatase [Jatrophihabitans sp. DSM 45814]